MRTVVQERQWVVTDPAPQSFLSAHGALPRVVAQLLYQRGVREEDAIAAFLYPDYDAHRHDPFLFRDMAKAVDRLFAARERGEAILVHGDYDADGVSGAAVLEETLAALGCTVDTFIPHREEDGYGFREAGLAYACEIGARVIITCDCGIANAATVVAANESGIDVIITDHHLIPTDDAGTQQPPPAHAILHPKVDGEAYPEKQLTGGGVAFKLAEALCLRDAERGDHTLAEGFSKWLLDAAAISTVADFGPLTGENRVIVRYGLVVLAKTRRLGLRKLYEVSGINPERITPGTIGFQIAPRINAAGRIDHASVALRLLRTNDPEEAAVLADRLNATNIERQQLVMRANAEALEQVGDLGDRHMLVVVGDWWPQGIVGLVAARLVEHYHRPAIALTTLGGVVAGSGRSIAHFHIVQALDSVSQTLLSYGGHPQACGLKLRDAAQILAFREGLEAYARRTLTPADLLPTLAIDAELVLADLTMELVEHVEMLQPYGIGNPTPRFMTRGLMVADVRTMGRDNAHGRITVQDGTLRQQFICFRYESICPNVRIGDTVDVVYELGINEWNGRRDVQAKIVDLRPTLSVIARSPRRGNPGHTSTK
ncbi:MAG: single-stranded-DNA-specific exonuclease RecJ [bacterium]|nr:single-stranded-DNA-specific exonuclease RecJ [bacterium]